MPRLPPMALDLVAYLYRDADSARRGEDFGGTAFFVSMASAVPNRDFVYAITNWHVAVADLYSTIRVNKRDGGTEILEFNPDQWEFDPKYDIAAIPVRLDTKIHRFAVAPCPQSFVMQESIEKAKLTAGEDVFMVGRFVDHDGGPVNRPSVRFGNISVMPSPIEQPNGHFADSYCIDLHSRSGYSGSPVFVYRTPGYDLEEKLGEGDQRAFLMAGTNYLALLGIHYSQFKEIWQITDEDSVEKEGAVPLVRGGKQVKGLSGMTCVLPAWCIAEVLNRPKFSQHRERGNALLLAEQLAQGSAPVSSSSDSSQAGGGGASAKS